MLHHVAWKQTWNANPMETSGDPEHRHQVSITTGMPRNADGRSTSQGIFGMLAQSVTYLCVKMVLIGPSAFLDCAFEFVRLFLSLTLSLAPFTYSPSPSASPGIPLCSGGNTLWTRRCTQRCEIVLLIVVSRAYAVKEVVPDRLGTQRTLA